MTNQEAGSARAQVAGELTRESFRRPWRAQLGAYLMAVLVTVPAVWICDWLLSGFHAGPPGGPLLFAAVLGLVGVVLQPLLVGFAVRLGWLGVLLLAFLGQALMVMVAAWLLPMVTLDDYWSALVVAIVVGLVATVLGWVGSAGTSQVLVGRLVSTHRRRPVVVDDPEVDGVLFVQMDGVPFPVLQMAITAGTVPTLTRWIRSGSHLMTEWTPKLPATTPASQMGILHGVIDGIPAFRWYDRARDKVMVANKPADAAVIEEDMSTGRGLLVDDGVSISNLFTGDAPTAVLTMSRRARGGELAQRAVANFVLNPSGLTRALSRTVSELTRDRFQAKRAIRRDVQPRCERTWETALLRSVTNGALRDLNTILVAEHLLRGTRSIYVDYVDYDEVAHHAGVLRPESLEALEAIDAVLHQLEQVAAAAPRRYRIVIVSDHGQSQGAIFADRYGEDLAALVARLADSDVAASDDSVEGWGRTQALVDELASPGSVSGRRMTSASQAMDKSSRNQPDQVTPGDTTARSADRERDRRGDLPRLRVRQPRTHLRARREGTPGPGRPPRSASPASSRAWRSTPASASSWSPTRTARSRWGTTGRTGSTTATSRATTPWPPSGPTRRGSSTASPTAPRPPTSTSTACSTRAPRRSPPSRAWSAATAGSAAGRTGPAP